MSPNTLTALQGRILGELAGITPSWTLTGGAALAGFHLGHRATRDLDLFWHGRAELEWLGSEVSRRLSAAGLRVESVQTAPSFLRLRVADSTETTLVDLVADPVQTIEAPVRVEMGSFSIQVDTRHEILVNKVCALLSRSETRDLVDLRALLEAGGDLSRALQDAPRKDAGFSGLILVWALRQLPLDGTELAPDLLEGLADFRAALIERLMNR